MEKILDLIIAMVTLLITLIADISLSVDKDPFISILLFSAYSSGIIAVGITLITLYHGKEDKTTSDI